MLKYILMFLLLTTPCYAITVTTARGEREINNGDTVKKISFWKGTMTGLKDVTFDGSGRGNACNFSRKEPHTEVFINCTNLTFIDCNLINVELQDDFTVESSLIVHKKEYEMLGKQYEVIEYPTGKTKTFRADVTEIDSVEQKYPTLTTKQKDELREIIPNETIKTKVLVSTEETPDDKKIKVKYVDPNTSVISNIGSVVSIDNK